MTIEKKSPYRTAGAFSDNWQPLEYGGFGQSHDFSGNDA
jgi:hypothetical protein